MVTVIDEMETKRITSLSQDFYFNDFPGVLLNDTLIRLQFIKTWLFLFVVKLKKKSLEIEILSKYVKSFSKFNVTNIHRLKVIV